MVIDLIAVGWMMMLFLAVGMCRASARADTRMRNVTAGDPLRPYTNTFRAGRPLRRALALREQAAAQDRRRSAS
jgi:hypothetical protein